MVRYCLVVGLVALVVTLMLAPACRVLAERVGCVARVRDRDVHAVPIPYLGGVAMFGGLWAGYLVATRLPSNFGSINLDDVRHVLLAGAIVFGFGLLDDIFDLPALAKLASQIITGAVLAACQVRLFFVPLPGGGQFSLDDLQSTLLTVVLVVIVANAVNLIDGLDGLAAGVVAAGGGALLIYSLSSIDNSEAGFGGSVVILATLMIGVCVGFYVHNVHPARIFMGDAGSLLLGTLLVASVILSTQLSPALDPVAQGATFGSVSRIAIFLWVGLPVAVIGLPTLDLCLAIVRRLKNGQPLFAPDKKHLHHILVQAGRSQSSASLLLILWAAIISCGAAWIVVDPSVAHILVVAACAALVLVYSEVSSRVGRRSATL